MLCLLYVESQKSYLQEAFNTLGASYSALGYPAAWYVGRGMGVRLKAGV